MNRITPDFLARSREAFAANRGMTLQHVRERIAESASGTTRRDLLSALDSVGRLYGRDLATIPATAKSLRTLLASKTAAQLGISEKRYANVRSLLSAAIRDHAETPEPITKRIPLSTDWTALLERIDKRTYRMALYRLAAYCSFMTIRPQAVDREVLVGFHEALDAEEIVKDPRRLLKHTIAHWNMCRKRVAGWPDITLSSPFKKAPISLPLTAFPTPFQVDLDGWRQRLLDSDILDPDAPSRALRPITVAGYVDRILRFGSALVHEGHTTLEQITGLGSLVEIKRYKAGLRFFLARAGKKPTPYIAQMANQLRFVAKHHCGLDSATLKEMEVICRNLEARHVRQLTDKNRERLRQFDNPENVAKLLAFPGEERARGLAHKNPIRAAKCFERGLEVDLFIHCTLRIGTLCLINLTTDLSWAGGKCFLSIDGSRVKNGQPLEFELPSETASLLAEYLRDHRPKLAGSEGPYLFPGRDGGPRPHGTIRHDFTEVMRKRCGLVMNPHLVRHTIAKIVVERDPRLYAVMSRQLGHKRMDTTMQNYLGTETRASGRHIDKLLRQALTDPTIKDE
jgi:site-specific recombinase XerC